MAKYRNQTRKDRSVRVRQKEHVSSHRHSTHFAGRALRQNKVFVLDTNILMHDPESLFRFRKHDVFICRQVLRELDGNKRGSGEAARNARQAVRYLQEIIAGKGKHELKRGIPIRLSEHLVHIDPPRGNMLFQMQSDGTVEEYAAYGLDINESDHRIFYACLTLQEQLGEETQVVLVTNDVNAYVQAVTYGIACEPYRHDQLVDDIKLLHSGVHRFSKRFWETHRSRIDSWQDNGHTYYRMRHRDFADVYINEFLVIDDLYLRVVEKDGLQIVSRTVDNYFDGGTSIFGIHARNAEQNLLFNLLMDPEVHLVSIAGVAGTGKTMLALAAGLQQTMEENLYIPPVIIARETIALGKEIGFLPGEEEEKMLPWMGAVTDNLEQLVNMRDMGRDGRSITEELLRKYIELRSIGLMRGRSIPQRYVIFDEVQNLTVEQVRSLITRAGPGAKVVCLGNLAQTDNPYLPWNASGLTHIIERFRPCPVYGHITLTEGIRSEIAAFAEENL